MAKKRVNERCVRFVEDYTNKPKGLILKCDVAMASHLIGLGVAKLHEKAETIKEDEVVTETKKTKIKKSK